MFIYVLQANDSGMWQSCRGPANEHWFYLDSDDLIETALIDSAFLFTQEHGQFGIVLIYEWKINVRLYAHHWLNEING